MGERLGGFAARSAKKRGAVLCDLPKREKIFKKRKLFVDNGRVEWYSIQALNEGGTKKRKNLAGNPAGRQKGA